MVSEDEKIDLLIIFGSSLILLSFFLPWAKYQDLLTSKVFNLTALNLLTLTYGIGLIPLEKIIDTTVFLFYQIPLIGLIIIGIIGIIYGVLRFFEKFTLIEENSHYNIISTLGMFSIGFIVYNFIICAIYSNILIVYNSVITAEGSGLILNFIGGMILLISSMILKKREI